MKKGNWTIMDETACLSVCLFNLLSIHKVESRTFLKHANTEAFLLKLRSLASII